MYVMKLYCFNVNIFILYKRFYYFIKHDEFICYVAFLSSIVYFCHIGVCYISYK